MRVSMVWISLFLLATVSAAGVESPTPLGSTLPSEVVDEAVDEIVHCLAGVFTSPFYALIYSIIYVLFDRGGFDFGRFLSTFGEYFLKNIENSCLTWLPSWLRF
jgi:hypothetical protein